MNLPVLETDRLILRKPAARDWPAAQAFYASDRSAGVGGPKGTGDAWRAFAMFTGHWDIRGYGLFAITVKGREDTAVGIAGPFYPEGWNHTEIGWHLWDPAFEGMGIAFEAAVKTRAYARDVLGWDLIVSNIDYDNDRSVALAKRMGAVLDTSLAFPSVGECFVYRHPKGNT